MENQETEGMKKYQDEYKRSKFLRMMKDTASNPTQSEMAPYTGEKSPVQEEIRNAEKGFNTTAYENKRMLDVEPKQYDFGAEDPRGNAIEAGRYPQSVSEADDITSLSQFSALQDLKNNKNPDPINADTINRTIDSVIQPNKQTEDYIKAKEGFRSVPYKDVGGNLTVGYGKNIEKMTPEQTQDLYKKGVGAELENRVSDATEFVDSYSQIPLTPTQKTAFVSLYDNAGPQVAKRALDIFHTNGLEASQDYFRKIINSGGKPVQGLINRRNEETAMLANEQLPSSQQNQNQTGWAQQQNLEKINEGIGQPQGSAFAGHQDIQPEATNTMNVMDKRMGVVQQGIGGAPMPNSWEDVGLGLGGGNKTAQTSPTDYSKLRASPEPVQQHQEIAKAQISEAEKKVAEMPVQTDAQQEALDALKKHTMEAAKLAQDGNMEAAKMAAKNADEQFKKIGEIADIQKSAMDQYKSDLDAIDAHVNKSRMWDDMPISNKLIAAVSLFAGAFTRDGKNRALASFQQEQEKDLQAQKLEYDRKGDKAKTAYALAAKYADNEGERLKMASLIQSELINAKLEEIKAGQIVPQAQVAIDTLQYGNEVKKKELMNEQLKNKIEFMFKMNSAEMAAQRANYFKAQEQKLQAERSSQWGNSVVRRQRLAESFDALAPRRQETIEMTEKLADKVQMLSGLKVSNPYYKHERDSIMADIHLLAGRFASLVNDKTGGIVVKEADLAEEALKKITAVDQLMNAVTTPNGAMERANDVRAIAERVKDSARRAFNGAYMTPSGGNFSPEETDSMLGFTRASKQIQERRNGK